MSLSIVHRNRLVTFNLRAKPQTAASSAPIWRLESVEGAKKLGVRLRKWLTAEQAHTLWQAPDREQIKGKRDRALLALLARGLCRHELAKMAFGYLQQRALRKRRPARKSRSPSKRSRPRKGARSLG